MAEVKSSRQKKSNPFRRRGAPWCARDQGERVQTFAFWDILGDWYFPPQLRLNELSTTPDNTNGEHCFTITHPFHTLCVILTRYRGVADVERLVLKKEIMMPKPRPGFPAAFKEEAVQLAKTRDEPKTQIARELGISYDAMRYLSTMCK